MSGVVVDPNGQPVKGAMVLACTINGRTGESFNKCPRLAKTRTDSAGRFQFGRYAEWEWCCLGEAPLPLTVLAACAYDARGEFLAAPEKNVDLPASTESRIELAPRSEESRRGLCKRLLDKGGSSR